MHRIYLNRSSYARAVEGSSRSGALDGGGFALRVDAENLFSLQLWKCDGPQLSKKRFEYCYERPSEPAKGVRTEEGGTKVIFTDVRGTEQRPFLVHSNGKHFVMNRDETHLRPLLDLYERPTPSLMRHPVVLVDTADHGPCNVTTLGWLMNATRWPGGHPWLRL